MGMKVLLREVVSLSALLSLLVGNAGAQAIKPEKRASKSPSPHLRTQPCRC